MAKVTIEICTCDICKKKAEVRTLTIPVRWLTEQTEGKYIHPHIVLETKDICEECLDKITKVNATGAQGINEYKLIS